MAVQTADAPVRSHRQARWRFTADQYVALYETGVLPPDQNTELIEGEIYIVPPPGPLHASSKTFLFHHLILHLGDRGVVWVEDAVRLGDNSVVQPDVAILRPGLRQYRHRVPDAADVLMAVEVANTSLANDRRRKLPLYARYGVPEVWLVSLPEQRLEVRRDPFGRRYRDVTVLKDGDKATPLCAPDIEVDVAEVLWEGLVPETTEGSTRDSELGTT